MKKTFLATLIALAGFSTTAWSMTYSDQDLLVAFRGANNDVVFNLGSVTNFLGKTSGAIINVTNCNIDVVKSQNGGSLAGVQVVLAATSHASYNTVVYLTDADAADNTLPARVASVGDQASTIDKIGTVSVNYGAADTNYNAAGHSSEGSYSQIIPAGTVPAKWSGVSAFNIETGIPGVLPLIQLQGYAYPVKLGAFSFDASGNLTFVAGFSALVLTRPSIVTPPSNVTVGVGDLASFTVVAAGNPLSIQWSVNDTIIPDATNSTYSYTATVDNDGDVVSVSVGNQMATYSASATLTLGTLPVQPTVGAVTCVNGTVSFSFPTEASVTYTVLYSPTLTTSMSTWTALGSTILGDGNPAVVTDVATGTSTRFYAIKATR